MSVPFARARIPAGMLAAAIALCALVALAFAPSRVAADTPLPDDFSATDQYVESIPTARGPKAPSVHRRASGEKKVSLHPLASARLDRQGGSEESTLRNVATSPKLGAPERRLPSAPEKAPPSVPSAAVSVAGGDGGESLSWLLVILVLTTGLALGTAAYRRFANRKTAA